MELESIGRNIRKFRLIEESATRRPGRDGWVEYQLCRCAGAGRKNTITRNLHCTLERFGGIIRYGAEQSIGGEASG